ncbi:hypothetical protein [Streptomyces violascens]|uniref:Uncharacterized protein n=1 Tax=Streptomyces violascens TaxID=67381 RepID=A0ABQ3QRW0_9ACTN|nr:hypothetical protein [Streptomyces violascens]GGT84645.1 hypothetical protein GCM10010289_00170 [Streptomyces violascens]GHI40025.1 hypothetical protein Sviol_44330 [Streptomyces violascens]
MPSFETLPRFTTDLHHLTPAQHRRFRRVVLDAFVPDLRTGRPGLRIKGVRRAPGTYELTWAPDGRATWSYGKEKFAGPHIVWHRIGTHSILDRPLTEGRLVGAGHQLVG